MRPASELSDGPVLYFVDASGELRATESSAFHPDPPDVKQNGAAWGLSTLWLDTHEVQFRGSRERSEDSFRIAEGHSGQLEVTPQTVLVFSGRFVNLATNDGLPG